MKKIFLLAATATVLFSCKKDDVKNNFFKGTEVQLYQGKTRTWVKLDDAGAPKQIGITIDAAALSSLPIGHDSTHGEHAEENTFVLPLHPKAKATTPFDHVELDWNPEGHPPMNIYGLPHFDMHFYMVPDAEVKAVVLGAKMDNMPGTDYLPAHYISPVPGVPQMGRHWLDATSPELDPVHPKTFTQTFIYGSYDGKVTFYEPMITLDFLKVTSDFQRAIPQPAKFAKRAITPRRCTLPNRTAIPILCWKILSITRLPKLFQKPMPQPGMGFS